MHEPYLTPDAILDNLGTRAVPRRVLCYERVSSTMDVAREQMQHRPDEDFPLLVLAHEQQAGRGRMGRPWVAPPGSALLFSLVLRPAWLKPEQAAALIWLAGVGMCQGIAAVTRLQPRLKWPNDVLLPTEQSMAKVAGILLESSNRDNQVRCASIGCGLNVSACPPPELMPRYPATSLEAQQGEPVPLLPLLRAILQRLDHWYTLLQQGGSMTLFAAWRDLLVTPGQQVQIETDSGTLRGLAEGVEPSGALRVIDEAGKLHIVTNGDVSG
jgi:BirA family biotin operon repressor/biotin-[acetyl-CoA-carboxylase] ligase